jgi:hypothetical protein
MLLLYSANNVMICDLYYPLTISVNCPKSAQERVLLQMADKSSYDSPVVGGA